MAHGRISKVPAGSQAGVKPTVSERRVYIVYGQRNRPVGEFFPVVVAQLLDSRLNINMICLVEIPVVAVPLDKYGCMELQSLADLSVPSKVHFA
jgi:hypothetical protein